MKHSAIDSVSCMTRAPKILVFDSGLGGLTVFREVTRRRPDGEFLYVADDAVFPYGRLSETALVTRVTGLMMQLIATFAPDAVVIACNTASTLVLPHLRAQHKNIHFIGTVPAIKPAASRSRSHMISVLATPGTVARDYTHELVRTYAAHCDVTLVGSSQLASLAEAFMRGECPSDEAVTAEIAPCFNGDGDKRTDCIVLACTHYPLLLSQFERLAPWPVEWIDPASAIARRTDHILAEMLGLVLDPENIKSLPAPRPYAALFTSATKPGAAVEKALGQLGIEKIILPAMEFSQA
jgi:glutamate racemase